MKPTTAKQVTCPDCLGKGAVKVSDRDGTHAAYTSCPTCFGNGTLEARPSHHLWCDCHLCAAHARVPFFPRDPTAGLEYAVSGATQSEESELVRQRERAERMEADTARLREALADFVRYIREVQDERRGWADMARLEKNREMRDHFEAQTDILAEVLKFAEAFPVPAEPVKETRDV